MGMSMNIDQMVHQKAMPHTLVLINDQNKYRF